MGKGQQQAALNAKRKLELDARTAKVGELWASGERHVPTIAEKVGCSSKTIYRHLRRLKDVWYKEMASDANRVIGTIVAESTHVLTESLKAWDRSCGKHVTRRRTITAVGRPPPEGEPDERPIKTVVTETERTSDGDPRFLAEVRETLTLIARVTGVYQRDINLNVDGDVNLTAIMQSIEKGRSAQVIDVESAPPASGNGNGRAG